MNWVQKFENGVIKVEQFFNNLNFIPRLLSSLKVASRAFADEFLKDDPKRKREIADRMKQVETKEQVNNDN